MLKQIEEIEKSRPVERIHKKILTYSFNLSTNEYYCPNSSSDSTKPNRK